MTESIIDILAKEHRHVEGLFSQIEEHPDKREELFAPLRAALTEHARSEERVLYPQLEALKDLEVLADTAFEEHDDVHQLLSELDSLDIESPEWLLTLRILRQTVNAHVQFEESTIFENLRQYFLVEELQIMGDEYHRVENRVRQVENVVGAVRNARKAVTKTLTNKVNQFFK